MQILFSILPHKQQVFNSIKLFLMITVGAILLFPLVSQLPMLGHDWYFFFYQNDPNYNLISAKSAYPPWDRYIISLFTWMNWRSSLAFLHSLTITSIAIGTWQQKGRYGSILLALLSPPLWILLWIGHPDGLVIFGLVTGLIPIALIKPQLSIWAYLSNRIALLWVSAFLILTLIAWPLWPLRMLQATFYHEAAFGWAEMGWPIFAVGLVLLLMAGNQPYRLIAAGFLVTPYLMPYNLPVLLPIIGQAKGWRKMALWATTWLVPLGIGGMGHWKYLSLVFPVTAYLLTGSLSGYWNNIRKLTILFQPEIYLDLLQWAQKNNQA